MSKRDLLSLEDLTPQEIRSLLKLAAELKRKKGQRLNILDGKSVGLLFQKPSNRTRVSFEVGTWQLGGNCIYLGPHEIDLGKRESPQDVARTLSRYLDALIARTNTHQDVIELAKNATVPVINGLSDLFHPCQALADVFSIGEKFGRLKDISVAYIGDGNNVCHSLMLGCAKVGMTIKIATPKGYGPNAAIVRLTENSARKSGSAVTLTNSAQEAANEADVIYTDVWVSMGQEDETKRRLKIFKDYQINSVLTKQARPGYIFMHCLPAHRGQEVTADVIDGKNSIVFDQAENRMHVQKAVLAFLLK